MPVAVCAALGAGCGHKRVVEYPCAELVGTDKRPQQTPELVHRGTAFLDGALRELARSDEDEDDEEDGDAHIKLRQANDCFGRALRITPDSYDAQIGTSVAYLAFARMAEPQNKRRLLGSARSILGRAYMSRHGGYEPLYYLAEVAVAAGDLAVARRFLEVLRVAGVKEGPVNMLLGYVSELQDMQREAAEYYRKAVLAGWPSEIASFAADRIRTLGDNIP